MRFISALALFLIALASPAWGAVAFDAVGSGSNTNASSLTFSITIVSATNGLVTVGCGLGVANTNDTITGVTFAGSAMTKATSRHCNDATCGEMSLWYFKNTSLTGAQTIVASRSGTPDPTDAIECGAVSFTGVDQTTPIGTPVNAVGNSTAPSVAVNDSVAGDLVVDALATGSFVTSSGQTNRWLINVNAGTCGGNGAGSTATGGGTVTMSYTVTSDFWAIGAVSVKQVSAGGGAGPPMRMLMGVGL